MDFTDDDWDMTSNPEDLARYKKDGRDLSAPITQGQRLADLRILAEISAEDLAQQCGVTSQMILALEAGLSEMDPALAQRLATHLGVQYSDLWIEEST